MDNIPVKNKIGEEKMFKISSMKEVIKPTKPHKHDNYYEIIFLTQGAGTHTIDTHTYDINPPVLFFLQPRQIHCWDFIQIPKGYVILFKEALIAKKPELQYLILNYNTVNYLENPGFINSIAEELTSKPGQDLRDEALILAHLHLMLLEGKNASKTLRYNPLLLQFKKAIEDHFHKNWSVADYVEHLNTSLGRLNTVCKDQFGKNAVDLIKERLVLEAKVLLTYSDKTISEIAFALNFSDPSNFVKFFKSHTNITPGHYRELL